jgi:hypothetical protein
VPDNIPSSDFLTAMTRRQIVLNPEKFGVMGTYSREMLRADASADYAFPLDHLALRLVTTVLTGRTIREEPQVELNLPAGWWQHLKHAITDSRLNFLASKYLVVFFLPFYWLFDKYLAKRPVKWTKVTAKIDFSQHILYPEIDAPAQCGRPVIYEEMSVSWPEGLAPYGSNLSSGPSRFMDRHEIASRIMRDPEMYRHPRYGSSGLDPWPVLVWLERNGVNVDQLVKR